MATPSPVPEGVLLGIGNPLLDITVSTDESFLSKYGLEANNAILAEQRHMSLFSDLMSQFEPLYMAGGATQNSIRIAQWLLGKPNATTFFGCVGKDEPAGILMDKARGDGVKAIYQVYDKMPTGLCGAIITGSNRSLVAHLGAADCFSHEFLGRPENWALVEQAHVYYIGGFVFPVCTTAIQDVAAHACKHNKTLVMNLSAPFLCQYFANPDIDIMPYVDILFGNETEAAAFCKLMHLEATDLPAMALAVARLPKKTTHRGRTVVFTQGANPTIVAHDDQVNEHPVLKVDPADICDTNGCGDAFVGGFLSQLVQCRPITDCLRCGNYSAHTVIKHWGCGYPSKPDFQ